MENEKKQVDEKIADALGIDHDHDHPSTTQSYHGSQEEETQEETPELDDLIDQSIQKTGDEKYMEIDFIHARAAIKRLILRGEEMFEDSYRVAQETDNARSYEVAGKILKDIIDSNHNLIKMHEERAKARRAVENEKTKITQNNNNSNNTTNVFTGTTKDLLKQILGADEESTTKRVENEAEE